MKVPSVAELLGNTEGMIQKHYGAWVPERQERLTRILREAVYNKPRPSSQSSPQQTPKWLTRLKRYLTNAYGFAEPPIQERYRWCVPFSDPCEF